VSGTPLYISTMPLSTSRTSLPLGSVLKSSTTNRKFSVSGRVSKGVGEQVKSRLRVAKWCKRENRSRKPSALTSRVQPHKAVSSLCPLADVPRCCCLVQAKASKGKKRDCSPGSVKGSKWSNDQTLGFEAWLNYTLLGADELSDDDVDKDGDVDVGSTPFKAMISMVGDEGNIILVRLWWTFV